MTFVDTDYFVALADPADQLHSRAWAWARVAVGPMVVTEYVLWETVNFFSHPVDRPTAHTIVTDIENLRGYQIISASPELFRAGLKLHRERPDKHWSLTDCISFHVMDKLGMRRALAYDEHFEQAGFETLIRRDPP